MELLSGSAGLCFGSCRSRSIVCTFFGGSVSSYNRFQFLDYAIRFFAHIEDSNYPNLLFMNFVIDGKGKATGKHAMKTRKQRMDACVKT